MSCRLEAEKEPWEKNEEFVLPSIPFYPFLSVKLVRAQYQSHPNNWIFKNPFFGSCMGRLSELLNNLVLFGINLETLDRILILDSASH